MSRIGQYIIEHDLLPEKLEPDPIYDWREEQKNDPDYEKWANELDKPF